MHISRVELENIKSHASATFQFTPGTTAITGENGAGKTTIIEAIAWALFDVLDYKKEDFVRRGAGKGSVRVVFVSGLDGREYEVYRDSGAGYCVSDPRLGRRLAEKKEEVFRFLWQHLGLEPGTDLRSLFKQAIGVPQGTFTAIFLDSPLGRKAAFDRLLKVDEYRDAAAKLGETKRYLEMSIATARESIARAEGELSRIETVESELKAARDEAVKLEKDVDGMASLIGAKRELLVCLQEAERVDNELIRLRSESKYVLEKLEAITAAKVEIETLRPMIVEQERLEKALSAAREKVASAKAVETQAAETAAQLQRLRAAYKLHTAKLRETEANYAASGNVAELEQRSIDLIRRLAEKRAHLERDERFQSEIRGGFCPVLSERCLNIKEGQTLEIFLDDQFIELRSHIVELETEHSKLNAELVNTRQAQLSGAALEEMRRREQELRNEGTSLADRQKRLDAQAADRTKHEAELASLEKQLTDTGDPRGRVRLLEIDVAREDALKMSAGSAHARIGELEREQVAAAEQLKRFPGAKTVQIERDELHALEKSEAVARAGFEAARNREMQLETELKRLNDLRSGLATEFRERDRLVDVAEATDFIRATLKEAAPRVARNYVYHVSLEANQMFREIMGTGDRSLKWAEDYSITLEEDGFERPFASLSGGEQMAAALAVRLAILKQLSDIRIAFFDEPTTNMDAERRENLALQISRITHFDQLFVISHDETFDNYVDNVVSVHRTEPAVTRTAA